MRDRLVPVAPRRAAFAMGALLLLGGCAQQAPEPPNPYRNAGEQRWSSGPADLQPLAFQSGDNPLSALAWTAASSGWGPIEKDRSNGEQGAGDGRPLTLNGVTYARGLGLHADSAVTYALNGQCQAFRAAVGLDDEVDTQRQYGSVVFQVWADGAKLYDSGTMTGASATKTIDVAVSGRQELKLVVTNAGDNTYYDHADWADARLVCQGTGTTRYLSDLTPTAVGNGWGPYERDRSNGEMGAADGRTLTIGGRTYAKGLGVHAESSQTYAVPTGCHTLRAEVGLDDEVGSGGSVTFQVYGAGTTPVSDSGRLTGADPARALAVNVAGLSSVRLAVGGAGDGLTADHADWASARFECGPVGTPAPASVSVPVAVPASMRAAPFDVPRTLRVPPGFAISVYARVGGARFLLPLPNGDLLVSHPGSGRIRLVRPGAAGADPQVSDFASGLTNPHDLVLDVQGTTTYLYVAESHRISRSVYVSGDVTRRAAQTAVANLPDNSTPELRGAYSHALKNIAIDAQHQLYVSIASATNADPSDLAGDPVRAAVYQYAADGSGGRLYARGLRNAEGLAFVPGTSDLWVAVNNRDNIAYPFHNDWLGDGTGDDYGKVIPSYVDNHPPEAFTRVRDGGNYGWPYCNPNPDAGLDNMPFDRDVQTNADGRRLDCGAADRISKGIQAHSAPLGLSFLQGSAVPPAYRNGAVIGLHGCWNCTKFVGHKVVFFPWTAAGTPGAEMDLVTGWVTDPVNKVRWGRPVDAVPDAAGNLLISDDAAGAIYRLSPTGQ